MSRPNFYQVRAVFMIRTFEVINTIVQESIGKKLMKNINELDKREKV